MSSGLASPRVERLRADHDRSRFESGVDALDQYLRHQAGQDARRRLAAPFVMMTASDELAGYYTLSATALSLRDLPDQLARRLPRYPLIPATLLGRLAVDRRFRARGFGRLLLADALRRAWNSEIASHAVIVDAKDSAVGGFYLREGFQAFPRQPQRLFLTMSKIADLFD